MPFQYKTILFVVAIIFSHLSAKASEIRIRPSAIIANPVVCLGDIADISDLDANKAAELSKLELFPTPTRMKHLRFRELGDLLELRGVNLGECRFSGSSVVAIQPQPVRPVTFVKPKPALKIAEKEAPKPKEVPKIEPIAQPTETPLVAARQILRGQLIRPEDIATQQISGPHANSLDPRLQKIVGMEATSSIAVGEVFDLESLRKPILVRRNQVVTAIGVAAGVRVKRFVRCQADGGHGELVEVTTPDRKHRFVGRVVDYETVEVYAQSGSGL